MQLCPRRNQFELLARHIAFGEVAVHVEYSMIPLISRVEMRWIVLVVLYIRMMIPKNIEIVGITYTAIAHRWAARDGAAIVDALHWYDGELLPKRRENLHKG